MVRDDLWHPLTMLLVVDMSLLWRCLWAFLALLKASKHLRGIEIWLNCHAVSVIWHRLWDSKKAATRPESTFQAIPQHEKNPFKYVVRVQGCVPKMCWNNLKFILLYCLSGIVASTRPCFKSSATGPCWSKASLQHTAYSAYITLNIDLT